jgi:hypothetical protein
MHSQSRHIPHIKSKNAVCDGMTTTAVENLPMMRKFQSSLSCEDHHPLYLQLIFFVCACVSYDEIWSSATSRVEIEHESSSFHFSLPTKL